MAVEFLDSVEGAAMRAHSRNDGYLDLRIHDRDECGDKLHRAKHILERLILEVPLPMRCGVSNVVYFVSPCTTLLATTFISLDNLCSDLLPVSRPQISSIGTPPSL